MSFEAPNPENKPEKEKPSHMIETFPMGDAFLDHYRELHPDDPERLEIMRDIVYLFVDHELRNTEIFKSEETGAEMPITVVNIKTLAEEIYKKYHGKASHTERGANKQLNKRQKKKFIMSSFQSFKGGNQFGYVELVLHDVMKKLPTALKDIKEGREPEDYEIYTLGSPSNEMGCINNRFLEKLREDTFGAMGEMYAECVSEKLEELTEEQRRSTTVSFEGVSMGASMASEAAKVLLESGKLTQENSDDRKEPRLRVTMHVPAALNQARFSKLQIAAGYAIEAPYKYVTEPGVRTTMAGQEKLYEEMYQALPEIKPRMDEEQKKKKKEALSLIRKAVMTKSSVPDSLQVNEIIGKKDLLMYSPVRNKEFQKQKNKHAGSLGENIIRGEQNERIFGADMSHRIPFYRENEFKRWDALYDTLLRL